LFRANGLKMGYKIQILLIKRILLELTGDKKTVEHILSDNSNRKLIIDLIDKGIHSALIAEKLSETAIVSKNKDI
jgi:hypothetical protein